MDKPEYLYKIVSESGWEASREEEWVELPDFDHDFIHLATDQQLELVCKKFWGKEKSYYVLKVVTGALVGKLVLEANPGGQNKYWHLYDGAVPMSAVESVDRRTNA